MTARHSETVPPTTSSQSKTMKYAIGIDLGTTNTELAYCALQDGGDPVVPTVLEIPQFVDQGVVESRSILPSALYLGDPSERELADWHLPWETTNDRSNDAQESGGAKSKEKKGFLSKVLGLGGKSKDDAQISGLSNRDALCLVGEIASRRAANFPEKTALSAKSWLAYSKVDRRRPILPKDASKDSPKVSPVEASRRYLAHLVNAWNHAFPDAPIFDQLVVTTVPASFDESARELTREAAFGAGLNPSTMLFLEEPQAAMYAWLADRGRSWRRELSVGDVVLICDVGGGTTDLSLIRVEDDGGALELNRLAVGDRLLLGGDNIDLALAVRASELFSEKNVALNPWQSSALLRQCRVAKEKLLAEGAIGSSAFETHTVAVEGRSSKLVGDAVSIDFPKQDAAAIAVDGFFPFCDLADRPARRSGFGLREVGLPYEADPAITKHVARFLRSRLDDSGAPIAPTRYLLNGGVFKSKAICERFDEQLRRWFPDAAPTNLSPDADLDFSVARGAAYYAVVKMKGGERIRGASARSYYVGIEASGLAVPGMKRPLKALCVAPAGMEEGTSCDVPSGAFELTVGETAQFRFFSSATRPNDKPGVVLEISENDLNDNCDLTETDPITTLLDVQKDSQLDSARGDGAAAEYVAVAFRTVITELGALEIWFDEIDGDRRWKLEFSVRED